MVRWREVLLRFGDSARQHASDRDREVEERGLAPVRWPGKRSTNEDANEDQPLDQRAGDIEQLRTTLAEMNDRGMQLPEASRFGALLGADLSSVRVHTSGRASELAAKLGARAFTHGSHVAFAPGSFDLASARTRYILAHELVHVVQNQRGGRAMKLAAHLDVGPAGSAVEREAERGAAHLVGGNAFRVASAGPLPGVSLLSADEAMPSDAELETLVSAELERRADPKARGTYERSLENVARLHQPPPANPSVAPHVVTPGVTPHGEPSKSAPHEVAPKPQKPETPGAPRARSISRAATPLLDPARLLEVPLEPVETLALHVWPSQLATFEQAKPTLRQVRQLAELGHSTTLAHLGDKVPVDAHALAAKLATRQHAAPAIETAVPPGPELLEAHSSAPPTTKVGRDQPEPSSAAAHDHALRTLAAVVDSDERLTRAIGRGKRYLAKVTPQLRAEIKAKLVAERAGHRAKLDPALAKFAADGLIAARAVAPYGEELEAKLDPTHRPHDATGQLDAAGHVLTVATAMPKPPGPSAPTPVESSARTHFAELHPQDELDTNLGRLGFAVGTQQLAREAEQIDAYSAEPALRHRLDGIHAFDAVNRKVLETGTPANANENRVHGSEIERPAAATHDSRSPRDADPAAHALELAQKLLDPMSALTGVVDPASPAGRALQIAKAAVGDPMNPAAAALQLAQDAAGPAAQQTLKRDVDLHETAKQLVHAEPQSETIGGKVVALLGPELGPAAHAMIGPALASMPLHPGAPTVTAPEAKIDATHAVAHLGSDGGPVAKFAQDASLVSLDPKHGEAQAAHAHAATTAALGTSGGEQHAVHPAAHAGHAAAPKPPPMPPAPVSKGQAGVNAYIEQARRERDAAKAKVHGEQLGKCSQVTVDAHALATAAKSANDVKLAKLRVDAAADKVKAQQEAAARKAHEGPVTIESLKAKLESTAETDKAQLKATFESKTKELDVRIQNQKGLLQSETEKQIANIAAQEATRKDAAKKKWEDEKKSLDAANVKLMATMRAQVVDDQKQLEANKGKLSAAANKRIADITAKGKADADALIAKGKDDAKALVDKATTDGQKQIGEHDAHANQIRAKGNTDAQASSDNADAIRNKATGDAAAESAAGHKLADDLNIKAKLASDRLAADTKKQADAIVNAAKKQNDDLAKSAADQVKAIGDKITGLDALGKQKIKQAGDDLQKKLAAGQQALDSSLAKSSDAIAKIKADADAKLAKLEDGGQQQLAKDYDTQLRAIDQRVEIARKQLAAGSQKNIQALEKMVDQACTAIDKNVTDAEKKFDAHIAETEKKASALVIDHLKKIAAEAAKALAAIDAAFTAAMKQVDDAIEATYRTLEETAKGKMLEVEVHTATLFADTGDDSRLKAVKDQLAQYIKTGQKIPEGYGETAKPEPPGAEAATTDKKPETPKPVDPAKTDADDKQQAANAAADAKKQQELLDPKNLSPEGIEAKVQEQLKKGQSATNANAAEVAQKNVAATTQAANNAVRHSFNHEVQGLDDLQSTDKDVAAKAGAEVAKYNKDKNEAATRARTIEDAATKKGLLYGTNPDTKAILRSMEGMDKQQVAMLRDQLKAQTPPVDLDQLMTDSMSGDDLAEAKVRLQGDPIMADVKALELRAGHHITGNEKTAMWILSPGSMVAGLVMGKDPANQNIGADQARIKEILDRYKHDPVALAKFKATYEEQTGQPLAGYLAQTGTTAAGDALGIKQPKPETGTPDQIKAGAQAQADALAQAAKTDPNFRQAESTNAVTALISGLEGFQLDGTRGDKVEAALKGKSPAEAAYIRAAYKAETGHDLDALLEAKLQGPALAAAKATMRGDTVTAAVNKLLGAEGASILPHSVDDKKMQEALRELTDPAQRQAVLEAYEARTGVSLEETIKKDMTGNDRKLAEALRQGDTLKARMVEMDEATNGGWLNSMNDAIADRTGLNTKKITQGIESGLTFGLIPPPGTAPFMIGGYEIGNGSIHKVDSEKILDLLEATPNPADRERLKVLYKQQTGRDMDDDMAKKLVDPTGNTAKLDAYKALQEGRTADAAAARMEQALDGVNDTKAFYKQIEGKPEWERQAIIAAYNKRHPDDPNAFVNLVNDQLGGLDQEKANRLAFSKDDARTGAVKLPDEFVLRYAQDSIWTKTAKAIDSATAFADKYPFVMAIPIIGQDIAAAKGASYFMRGWGVDSDAIKGVLKDKSPEEIAELRKQYPNLDTDLKYVMSGRDAFEVDLMLKEGAPQTPQEKAKRALALYEFDRGSAGETIPGFHLISNAITDTLDPSGKVMDAQAKNLKAFLSNPNITTADKDRLQSSLDLMEGSTGHFMEAREAITGAIATAVGAIAAATVTVLTGGAAGAVLGALAAGMATVATKTAMLGQAYGRNEMGVDIAMTVVQMATAGAGVSIGAKSFLGQVLTGAISNGVTQFVQTAITSKDAHDLFSLLTQASKAGLVGMLSGGAGAAATAGLGHALEQLSEKAFGQGAPIMGKFVKGFISGGGNAVASMLAEAAVNPEILAGNWDAVFAKLGQSFLQGAVQSGLNDAADGVHESVFHTPEHTQVMQEHAQSTLHEAINEAQSVKRDGGSIPEQQEAFGERMLKGQAEAPIDPQQPEAKPSSNEPMSKEDLPKQSDVEAKARAEGEQPDRPAAKGGTAEMEARPGGDKGGTAEMEGRPGATTGGTAEMAERPVAKTVEMPGRELTPTVEGLGDKATVASFTDRMKGIEAEWPSMSAPERQAKIAEALNVELRAQGLPEINVNGNHDLGSRNGELDFEAWSVKLNKGMLESGTMSAADMAKLANTALHEARHAEQWYLVARGLSEAGFTPAQITARTGIPTEIAEHARNQATPMTPEQKVAALGYFDSIYGKNAEYRNNTLDALGAKAQAYTDAKAELAAAKTPEEAQAVRAKLEAARLEARAAYDAYRNLPEEADAFRVGGAAEEKYATAKAKATELTEDPAAKESTGPKSKAVDPFAETGEQKARAAPHVDNPELEGLPTGTLEDAQRAHEDAVFKEAERLINQDPPPSLTEEELFAKARQKVVEDEIAASKSIREKARDAVEKLLLPDVIGEGSKPAETGYDKQIADALKIFKEMISGGGVTDKTLGAAAINLVFKALEVAVMLKFGPELARLAKEAMVPIKEAFKNGDPTADERLGRLLKGSAAVAPSPGDVAFLSTLVHEGVASDAGFTARAERFGVVIEEADRLQSENPELSRKEALSQATSGVNDSTAFHDALEAADRATDPTADHIIDPKTMPELSSDTIVLDPEAVARADAREAELDHATNELEKARAEAALADAHGDVSPGATAHDRLAVAEQELAVVNQERANTAAKQDAVEAREIDLLKAKQELEFADLATNGATKPGEAPTVAFSGMQQQAELRVQQAEAALANEQARDPNEFAPKDSVRVRVVDGSEPNGGGGPRIADDLGAHAEAGPISEPPISEEQVEQRRMKVKAAPMIDDSFLRDDDLPSSQHDLPVLAAAHRQPGYEATPLEKLAQAVQAQANLDRANNISPDQRKALDNIDRLAPLASTPDEFARLRVMEAEAKRPVSERLSHNDELAALQIRERVLGERLGSEWDSPAQRAAEKSDAHSLAIKQRKAEVDAKIQLKDAEVNKRELLDKLPDAPRDAKGRAVIETDAAISFGMGGAGSAGAHGDLPVGTDTKTARTDRIGIEDATKRELWATLGDKPMGQEADAICYGTTGVRTAHLAEHGSSQVAKASDLALQVALQRETSGVGTIGTEGPSGPLEFRRLVVDGKEVLEVGVPMKVKTGVDAEGNPIFEEVLLKTIRGLDLSTGMGPSRELSTEDDLKTGRKKQVSNEDRAKIGGQMLSGEQGLALDANAFADERVLGIGGGPTSEWAMEHALKGGASSAEIAGQMPRPKGNPEFTALETKIRANIEAGTPTDPSDTRAYHKLVEDYVASQRSEIARINELDRAFVEKDATPQQRKTREELLQKRDRLIGELDPFKGSRVDRNEAALNNKEINHVQADVSLIKARTLENGKVVQDVYYTDGSLRTVDRVISSIGSNPDLPGGVNQLLEKLPPDVRLLPVISEGRVVGLESDPPGFTVSAAAMVGTLGIGPKAVMERIPVEMRDAVVKSGIDHANREDVSAGSRGIVPGIENVGSNTELTIGAKQQSAEEKQAQREAFMAEYTKSRERFGGVEQRPELAAKDREAAARVKAAKPAMMSIDDLEPPAPEPNVSGGGKPLKTETGEAWTGATHPADKLLFTQDTVSPTTGGDGGAEKIDLAELARRMRESGWRGGPIEVVGESELLSSIDNRRVLAATLANEAASKAGEPLPLPSLPVRIYAPTDPFPPPAWPGEKVAKFQLKNPIRITEGGLRYTGTTAPGAKKTDRIIFKPGASPTTMAEATMFRAANQGKSKNLGSYPEFGGKFPLAGSARQPFINKGTGVAAGATDDDNAKVPGEDQD